jgi:hypothetical protein
MYEAAARQCDRSDIVCQGDMRYRSFTSLGLKSVTSKMTVIQLPCQTGLLRTSQIIRNAAAFRTISSMSPIAAAGLHNLRFSI